MCLWIHPPLLPSTSECLNQSLWNLVSVTATSYIPPISLCLYVYPSYRCYATAWKNVSLVSLLGNGLVNTFPRQRIHATIEELLDICVCGSVYVSPISLLGNNSVRTFLLQRIIVGGMVFYVVRVVSKESRRLVTLRTSCSFISSQHVSAQGSLRSDAYRQVSSAKRASWAPCTAYSQLNSSLQTLCTDRIENAVSTISLL
jgi:hypothetical protein